MALRKKKINVEKISVHHPSLNETVTTNESKKKTYVNKLDNRDRELDTSADGATKVRKK